MNTTMGLVGYGYWGPNVARHLYNNKEIILKYICDSSQERLEKAKSVFAEAVEYITEFDRIIEDPEVDAVAIALNTHLHYPLAKKALMAGKHVYVEKPFTDKLADAEELHKLAIERGLKIHVDHIMVFHPVIKKIKEIIDSGDLGDIVYFDCSRINLGQIRHDVSSMWDLSVHDLSIIDFLTDGAEPVAINAMGQKVYSKKESITFLTLKFESFMANIVASWLSPIKERRILISGTRKMLVYDDVDVVNKLIIYDKGFDVKEKQLDDMEYDEYVVKTRMGDGVIPSLEQTDSLYDSIEHFRRCIVEDRESITNGEAAIRMIRILEDADRQFA